MAGVTGKGRRKGMEGRQRGSRIGELEEGCRNSRCRNNRCRNSGCRNCGMYPLDEMLRKECISLAHKHYIEAGKFDEKMNERLLNIILRQSVKAYDLFITCLQETHILPVASLLEPDIVGTVPPISDEQWSRIKNNLGTLIDMIDTANGLLDQLYGEDCVTARQMDFIQSSASARKENTRLLEVVRRMSASDFLKFIQCLNSNGQSHVGRVLSEDGIVAHLVVRFDAAEDVKETVDLTVERFEELMHINDAERREQYSERMCQVLDTLRSEMCEVFVMSKKPALYFIFVCKLPSGLQFLRDRYTSGQLKSVVNEIFDALLHKSRTAPLPAYNIEWNDGNYRQCV
jgi:hypothetical protein